MNRMGVIFAAVAGIAVLAVSANAREERRKARWLPARPISASPSAITQDTALAVIDMQPQFLRYLRDDAAAATLAAVLHEIDVAIAVGAPIVVVEYRGYGPTHAKINQRLQGYDRWIRIEKGDMGGGKEVLDACANPKLHCCPSKLRVCGIYSDQCVRETALEMTPKVSVEVVVHACCTESSGYDWGNFQNSRYTHVNLVEQAMDFNTVTAAA